MKICIPTEDDRGMAAVVAAHFGSARYFTMVDVDSDELTVKQNPACGHRPSSCHHIDILQAHGVDTVACNGIGHRALTALEEAGITVLALPRLAVAEMVKAARSTEAVPVTLERACGGGGGQRFGQHGGPSRGQRRRQRVRQRVRAHRGQRGSAQ